MRPEVQLIAQSTDHVVLSLGGTRLIVSARDVAPGMDANKSLDRSQIRVMAHDQYDALFGELDANADGRLGEREIDSCSVRLLAKDANSDGQLGTDEVTYSMIVAFLRGERAERRIVLHPGNGRNTAYRQAGVNMVRTGRLQPRRRHQPPRIPGLARPVLSTGHQQRRLHRPGRSGSLQHELTPRCSISRATCKRNKSSSCAPMSDNPIGAESTVASGIETCGRRPTPAMAVRESARR